MQDLTVAFKEKKLKKEIDKLAQELKKDVSIPGFRKGKVPVHMIKERFGPQLRSESLQKLMQEKIVDIIQQYEPFVYGPPVVKDFKEENEEVRLELSLDIPPEIDIDLSSIKIKMEKGEKIDISNELEKLREINSELKSVDRKIEKGDVVFLNVKKGDLLLIYSDGINEAMNDDLEEFGEERLQEIVTLYKDRSPSELIDRIISAIEYFIRCRISSDDMTLIAIKRK